MKHIPDPEVERMLRESYGQNPPRNGGPRRIVPEPVRTSTFYTAAAFAGRAVPPRQWLVPDIVPMNTVTLFGGDGGTGKSLLALQMAVAAASGCGWLGRPVTRGTAIYLTAEDDDDELHRRLDDITRAGGLTFEDLDGLTLRSLAGEDALLAVESQLSLIETALFNELDQRAAEDNPVLIVIDTLADVYPANENDRAKVRQFVGILRGLSLKRRCAVVLLGHPSLTGMSSGTGASGSTAWNNSVRSRLYLSRIAQDGYEPDPDARILETKKANYGRVGGQIAMRWRDGVFHPEAEPEGLDKMAAGAKAERVFLKLLRKFTEEGRRVSHTGPKPASVQFAEHPDRESVTKKGFTVAMNALFGRGAIEVRKEGPPSRQISFLAETSQ